MWVCVTAFRWKSDHLQESVLSFHSKGPGMGPRSQALTPPTGVNEGVARGRTGRTVCWRFGWSWRVSAPVPGCKAWGRGWRRGSELGVSGAWPAAGVEPGGSRRACGRGLARGQVLRPSPHAPQRRPGRDHSRFRLRRGRTEGGVAARGRDASPVPARRPRQ